MNNKWKAIWEKRNGRFGQIDMTDCKAVFLELKRIDGFDVVGGGITYEALIEQNAEIMRHLSKKGDIHSIFDVGCGCGANLYLFKNDGLEIGGIDYSSTLIEIAQKVLEKDSVDELICGEAKDLPTEIKYDAVVSNSVFSYFESENYAEIVLDKMLRKSRVSIGLIDVHDISKKEAFTEYRRKVVENYDERYERLQKFFYKRVFFEEWAVKHNLEIEFDDSKVEGYWNNDFVFNVFFYKKLQKRLKFT